MPSSFVLVYHRSPFDEVVDSEGQRQWQDQKSPNGIIPTLRNLFRSQPSGTWIAWREDDTTEAEDQTLTVDASVDGVPPIRLRRIPLRKEQIGSFYHVTSKEAIWPVLHSFPGFFEVNNADWATFQEVNRRFAEAACKEAAPEASIWIHDYNLWLTPGYIRELRPDVKISLFHHTPFPSSDVFSILPWREEILESLLCCDAVGFHIPRYAENFARAASSLLAVEKAPKTAVAPHFLPCGSALAQPDATPWIEYRGRRVQLVSTPVGTSPAVIAALRNSTGVQQLIDEIEEGSKRGRRLILSASRVDYTKGNQELLLAYERLLERRPDLHAEVVLVLACVAANSGMKVYADTQRSIEEMVGRINGRFSRIDWVPIHLTTQRIPYEEMVAWFASADICWITPLRDGLNLVAKEYAAARKGKGGTLVLSEFTGASVVMKGAVLTNPYSHRRMDEAIEAALAMPADQQSSRMTSMVQAVERLSVDNWAEEQLRAIQPTAPDPIA
ncbi:glucosylglycerol-phosphate synthase [Synechococcus sp. CB0101]|uniref:glucosylglycerol-phosphate synthase n=1 Tax=Synechococcus sp. CB0101 TaxID=232348 RepID=UPI000200154D|nr:glucosylglycerol-phosphate synthase [Synechococcus sp. CB0101]QCH13963.1 glucosylglycerol-phosphate synthase [Synechococcus sp. CB0101]